MDGLMYKKRLGKLKLLNLEKRWLIQDTTNNHTVIVMKRKNRY